MSIQDGRYKNTYFASEEAEYLVSYLQAKSSSWFTALIETDYLEKIKKSWASYHGAYYDNTHAITFGGEAGELVNIAINHYRNIASHMLNMVTATRPAFQAKAINTDAKSTIQVNLAQGLLEYYMREKRLEVDLKKAVEYSIVMGSGYIKMEWNATAGEIYDTIEADYEVDEFGNMLYDEEGEPIVKTPAFPIYEGDVEFNVLSPFDVVFDSTKESSKHDWQLCRTFKNKFDLAAKYPELAEEIKALQTKSDMQKHRLTLTPYDETVDVPVYEFFHRPTEALPKGRYVVYLDSDIVLIDTVMPYRNLPIFRITPGDILGTPYGYTAMFDLLPIQDAVNSLYSTILTNQSTFGVQNIVAEKNADISVSELAGGLNLIEVNPGSAPPTALNLTQTPAEIFNFVKMLEDSMQVISGINAVARGNMGSAEKNLRSGNALALLQSQALQFMSGLQQSYIQLIEDVGTNLVQLLKDFAEVPRIVAVAGKSNQTYMKYFSKEDLKSINRVVVDAGNALSQTTAGKVEMATQLIQMGIIKTPEEYMSVINTGRLENMTEGDNKELILVRREREALIDGSIPVVAILTDDHSLHIREHKAVLADPELRLDNELVSRVIMHIQEHIDILQNPNVANILSMLGQQPLPPQGGTPPNPQTVAPEQPNQQGAQETQQLLENPQAQSVAVNDQVQQMGLPQPAQAPAVQGPQGPVEQPTTPQQLAARNK
jgi:hypothetical protein